MWFRELLGHISRVTMADVKRVAAQYIAPLLEPSKSSTVVVCHPTEVSAAVKTLSRWVVTPYQSLLAAMFYYLTSLGTPGDFFKNTKMFLIILFTISVFMCFHKYIITFIAHSTLRNLYLFFFGSLAMFYLQIMCLAYSLPKEVFIQTLLFVRVYNANVGNIGQAIYWQ